MNVLNVLKFQQIFIQNGYVIIATVMAHCFKKITITMIIQYHYTLLSNSLTNVKGKAHIEKSTKITESKNIYTLLWSLKDPVTNEKLFHIETLLETSRQYDCIYSKCLIITLKMIIGKKKLVLYIYLFLVLLSKKRF